MPPAENDLTELFIRSFKCTGEVPPALVGSSLAYLNGSAYVFGGRALHSGKLSNDIYACDLRSYQWRRIEPGEEAPAPRFFHSATAFRHYLIVFGGMGLDADPETPTAPAATQPPGRSGSIQDDRNQQSFQVRTSKTLLGDIAVFDTRAERWVAERALDGSAGPPGAVDSTDDAVGSTKPAPRYAHLSTLFGHRLLVVGGQDLEEQYVEELNVFDLQLGRWVLRSPFPRAVGLYRSFIANVPATGSTLLYSNYSFASVKRALYLLSAPPDCTLKEISDQLDGEPPGLRFPRGHVVDPQTIIMSGTLISTEGHSEMCLWALDSRTLAWQPVGCGAKFRAGSWNQSIVDPRTNTLVVFGDSRRDLTYDYQRRRLNYSEIRAVDLRALGYLREAQVPELPPTISASPLAAAHSVATGVAPPQQQQKQQQPNGPAPTSNKAATNLLGFEIGSQLLHFTQFSDAEVVSSEGSCVAEINSGLLRVRWPTQAQAWQVASQPDNDIRRGGLGAQPGSRPESSLINNGSDRDFESTNSVLDDEDVPLRFFIDAPREVIYVLVFYLYTDVIDPLARFGLHPGAELSAAAASRDDLAATRILGELLTLARKYALDDLALRVVTMLRWRVNGVTAPLVYEAALRAGHQGLQARSVLAVRGHIGNLRMDRNSTLYSVSATTRSSLLKYFPKAAGIDEGDLEHDVRQRSASDVMMTGEYPGSNTNALRNTSAFTSPGSGSPGSSMRGSRSPYQQDLVNPRRPWEATMMASPLINSPASSRYSGQSPELPRTESSKRMSHLGSQPLTEDIPVSFGQDSNSAPQTAVSDSGAPSSNSSKRMSRYLGALGGSPDLSMDHRTSESMSVNELNLPQAQMPQHQPQPQHQPPPPPPPQQQQQQQQSSSSRSFFKPWSRIKKNPSSTQVNHDTLPSIPSQSSSFSGN
ncbi:hypothetical protein GGF46_004281 [Coemansia sp. RSA 552]|nr:hypothetical protein GGF46_004281 [Coemansia sp. RSA 552]